MEAIWRVLRVCGIAVGIFTLLRLATVGFGVEYQHFFQTFLDQVRNIVELGYLIDPLEKLVKSFLQWLRALNLSVPELKPHWQQVFTLLWLLLVAMARYSSGNVVLPIAYAFICALAAAVAAGTQELTSWAVLYWPLAGFFLFGVGLYLPGAVSGRESRSGVLLVAAMVIVTAAVGYLFSSPIRSILGIVVVDSFTLLLLVIFVGGGGIASFAGGLLDKANRSWHERLTNPRTATGLDILGVLGGALFIGWLMLK